MTLEEQLAKLETIGITLNDGISTDDLLNSFPREDYEKTPFDLLLFALGMEVEAEPWGRYFSDQVWNLDMECIEDEGAYRNIIKNLCRIAGNDELVSGIKERIDPMSDAGSLQYTIAGTKQRLEVAIEDDWADPEVVSQIMSDIESTTRGRSFYSKDRGLASIWLLLTDAHAKQLSSWGAELSARA
jgi:hypothetical protein